VKGAGREDPGREIGDENGAALQPHKIKQRGLIIE
jgi:hypothetical protein